MRILNAIKKYNDLHPEHNGFISLVLYDDGSGYFYNKTSDIHFADVYIDEHRFIVMEDGKDLNLYTE